MTSIVERVLSPVIVVSSQRMDAITSLGLL
jgi:hypothetical protein